MSGANQYVVGLFEGTVYSNPTASAASTCTGGVDDPAMRPQQKNLRWLLRCLPAASVASSKGHPFQSPKPPLLYGLQLQEDGTTASAFIKGGTLDGKRIDVTVETKPPLASPQTAATSCEQYQLMWVDDTTTTETEGGGEESECAALLLRGVRLSDGAMVALTRTLIPSSVLEESSAAGAVHFLVGNAAPDPSFATFIPFNAIEWLLYSSPSTSTTPSTTTSNLVAPSETTGGGGEGITATSRAVVGVGYIISGDVSDCPVILYSLIGQSTTTTTGSTEPTLIQEVRLVKRYEAFKETEDFTLDYKGVLLLPSYTTTQQQQDPSLRDDAAMAGGWINERGMSSGYFAVWDHRPWSHHPAVVFCSGCQRWLPIGSPSLVFDPANSLSFSRNSEGNRGECCTTAVCFDCAFPPNTDAIIVEPPPSTTTESDTSHQNSAASSSTVAFPSSVISYIQRLCQTPTAKFLRKGRRDGISSMSAIIFGYGTLMTLTSTQVVNNFTPPSTAPASILQHSTTGVTSSSISSALVAQRCFSLFRGRTMLVEIPSSSSFTSSSSATQGESRKTTDDNVDDDDGSEGEGKDDVATAPPVPQTVSYAQVGTAVNGLLKQLGWCLNTSTPNGGAPVGAPSSSVLSSQRLVVLIIGERTSTTRYAVATLAAFAVRAIVVPVPPSVVREKEKLLELITSLQSLPPPIGGEEDAPSRPEGPVPTTTASILLESSVQAATTSSSSTSCSPFRYVALLCDEEDGDGTATIRETLLSCAASVASHIEVICVPNAPAIGDEAVGDKLLDSLVDLGDAPLAPTDISSILFTSGSTSSSKGVVFTEDLTRPSEGVANVLPFISLDFPTYDPTFVLSLLQTVRCGGCRALCSDLSSLQYLEQIAPTHIGAPPTFWNAFYQDYLSGVSSPKQIAERLGARLQVATSGGGALSLSVLTFLRERCGIPLNSLYGSREAGGIARNGEVYDAVDVRVRTDDGKLLTEGEGEICVHTPRMVHGYLGVGAAPTVVGEFNHDDNSNRQFLCTGDWGVIRRVSDGSTTAEKKGKKKKVFLEVTGRKTSIVKAADGKWLDIGRLEQLMEQFEGVASVFLFRASPPPPPIVEAGSPPSSSSCQPQPQQQQECVHGVVQLKPTYNPGCQEEEDEEEEDNPGRFLRSLRRHALALGVPVTWIPQRLLLLHPGRGDIDKDSSLLFTAQNSLLTPSGKKRYGALRKTFSAPEVLRRFVEEPREDTPSSHSLPSDISDILRGLHISSLDEFRDSTLADLGLDSITAMRLAAALSRSMPRKAKTSPIEQSTSLEAAQLFRLTLGQVIQLFEDSQQSTSTMTTIRTAVLSSLENQTTLGAKLSRWEKELCLPDWVYSEIPTTRPPKSPIPNAAAAALERDVLPGEQHEAAASPPSRPHHHSHTGASSLLIGASGFLGPHIAVQLLLTSDPSDKVENVDTAMSEGTERETATKPSSVVFCVVRNAKKFWREVEPVLDFYHRQRSGVSTYNSATTMASRCSVDDLRGRLSVIEVEDFSSSPTLGLTEADLSQLKSKDVQHIVLNSAVVSHVTTYEKLRPVNVDGAVRVAMFAAVNGMHLHFISSVAAVPQGPVVSSSTPFRPITATQLMEKEGDPYGQTKAVAEALIATLCDTTINSRNSNVGNTSTSTADSSNGTSRLPPLRATFYRPSAIAPPSASGCCHHDDDQEVHYRHQLRNPVDAITTLVDTVYHHVGCYPKETSLDLHTVPVDFVAEVIATGVQAVGQKRGKGEGASTAAEYQLPRYFHITGHGPRLEDIFEALAAACSTQPTVNTASMPDGVGTTSPSSIVSAVPSTVFRSTVNGLLQTLSDPTTVAHLYAISKFGFTTRSVSGLLCRESTAELMGIQLRPDRHGDGTDTALSSVGAEERQDNNDSNHYDDQRHRRWPVSTPAAAFLPPF